MAARSRLDGRRLSR